MLALRERKASLVSCSSANSFQLHSRGFTCVEMERVDHPLAEERAQVSADHHPLPVWSAHVGPTGFQPHIKGRPEEGGSANLGRSAAEAAHQERPWRQLPAAPSADLLFPPGTGDLR